MVRLGIERNRVKQTLGSIAEFAARVKSNGRLIRYSPLSRLLELEGLAAGIVTKRSLWQSLQAIADRHTALDAAALDNLVALGDVPVRPGDHRARPCRRDRVPGPRSRRGRLVVG